MSKVRIKFGLGADPIVDQLARVGVDLDYQAANRLDCLNIAISILSNYNYFPETEITELRKKLSEDIITEVRKCSETNSVTN